MEQRDGRTVTAWWGSAVEVTCRSISDHKTNRETREIPNMYILNEVTIDHTNRGTQSLAGRTDTRYPKLVYGCIKDGRRNVYRPRKRWRDRKSMRI